MSYLVMSYDTEAIYPWWDLGTTPYSARLYRESVSYEGNAKRQCIDGIRAVADVHQKHNIRATFFVVGELARHAHADLRKILENPLFDIQCHGYSHDNLLELASDEEALEREIVESKKTIEDKFGREVLGLTTPGSFTTGLVGQKRQLELIWEAGYRYLRSVGKGPFDTSPAPLTQPFWYTEDGFPELLELGLHGWHDNVLSGQPFLCYWPPILPWGYPARMPTSAREMYDVYVPAIEYVCKEKLLTYVPCFHPWSIYRVDKKALHIDLLLTHAKRIMDIVDCTSMFRLISDDRSLASVRSPFLETRAET